MNRAQSAHRRLGPGQAALACFWPAPAGVRLLEIFFKGGRFICASVPLKTVTKAPVDSLLPFLAVPGTALSATPLSQLPRNTPPSTEPQGLESRTGQQERRSETQPLVVRTERPRQHRLSPIRQEGTLTGSIPVNFPVNSATELAGKGQNVLVLC